MLETTSNAAFGVAMVLAISYALDWCGHGAVVVTILALEFAGLVCRWKAREGDDD